MTTETGWIRGRDGLYRSPRFFPGAALTPEQYAALPAFARSWPRPGMTADFLTWQTTKLREARARVFGGLAVEAFALQLVKEGRPIAEALQRSQAVAPADRPGTFPRLAALFAQAGRVEEARYLSNPAAFTATAGSTTTAHQAGTARAPATAHQLTTETAAAGAALLALLLL